MAAIIVPGRPLPKIDAPLIFLAGPISCAPDWRSDAINYLFGLDDQIIIASPATRIKANLQKFIVSGTGCTFSRDRLWERHTMYIAGKARGSILFWLPAEFKHSCKKPYGSMTRVEFGEWTTRYQFDKSVHFCVGTDGLFPDLDPMLCDLSEKAPDKEVFSSLEDTCREALRLAKP